MYCASNAWYAPNMQCFQDLTNDLSSRTSTSVCLPTVLVVDDNVRGKTALSLSLYWAMESVSLQRNGAKFRQYRWGLSV